MSYELIETIEVGSGGASSIEFTSIPQDGVDLLLKMSIRHSSTSGDGVALQFSGDTGTNYNRIRLLGNGSTASSNSSTGGDRLFLGASDDAGDTANTFSNQEAYISNYTSSTAKSVSVDSVKEDNSSTSFQDLIAGQWDNTSAVTSIKLQMFSTDFVEHTTASLYKIS